MYIIIFSTYPESALFLLFYSPPIQYFRVPDVDQLPDSFILVINMLVWGYKIYISQKLGISLWIATDCFKWHSHSELVFCFVLLQHIGAKWESLFWDLQISAAPDHEQERKCGLQHARMVLKHKWIWVSHLKALVLNFISHHLFDVPGHPIQVHGYFSTAQAKGCLRKLYSIEGEQWNWLSCVSFSHVQNNRIWVEYNCH